jgi:hypothetical protein
MKGLTFFVILFALWTDTSLAQHRVLVLPYEDALLLSDFTDDLAEASQMTPFEAKKILRNGLCSAAAKAAPAELRVKSLSDYPDSTGLEIETKLFQSINRTYVPLPLKSRIIPLTPEDTGSKDSTHASGNNYLDQTTRYLSSSIADSTFITWLNVFYGYDYYVLINQLDLISLPGFFANSPPEKWMRAHYTIIDRNGDAIVGGIARGRFKEETKTIQDVVEQVAPSAMARLWENFK